ncbi:MAG: hypothetical protein JW731_14315 [Bacteroidales bacterium]|nr:hypothetical protein [Bacteroidales bacterium]
MKSTLKDIPLSPDPVFVHLDKGEFNRQLNLIEKVLIPILNQIRIEFLKLNIGPFTKQYFDDILFNDCMLIRSQVKPNKLIGLLIACKELQHPGRFELEILKDFPSIDETGEIVLTDESIEALREFNSIYAITPRGVELFRAHKAAAEALNEFYQLAEGNIDPTPESLTELFLFDLKGKIIPAPREYDLFGYVTSQEPQE